MSLFALFKKLLGGGKPYPDDAGFGLDELARRLDMDRLTLSMFEPKYREVFIPKRTGGKRRLHVPDDETKALQRRILHRLLAKLRVHDAAQGFEPERSIARNAVPHAHRAVVVRLDICDFFSSTSRDRVYDYFRCIGWNREAGELLTKLTTHEGGLPQGAPTSPRLSNLVNYILDARLAALARKPPLAMNPKTLVRKTQHLGAQPAGTAVYTRYADDITFSFDRDVRLDVKIAIRSTKNILADYGYRLHLKKKLHVRRRHQQQRVTGLVVNEKVQLPRKTRRWLRAVEHHIATGKPATLNEAQIAGWRALQKMISDQTAAPGS